MSIIFKTGDIFKSNCEAIVNPVNCVGVMGGGLALAFKKKYPDMFEKYKEVCSHRELVPGLLHIYDRKALIFRQPDLPHYIINFPTKDHWQNPSKLIYITSGLHTLQNKVRELEINSIAIPALGCGLGGLDWQDVKYYIYQAYKFSNNTYDHVYWEIYEPN